MYSCSCSIAQVVNLSLVRGETQADRCFKWKDHRYKMDYPPITLECDSGLMDTPLLSGHGCFGARIPNGSRASQRFFLPSWLSHYAMGQADGECIFTWIVFDYE